MASCSCARAKSPRANAAGRTDRALIDLCYHVAVVIEAGIPMIDGLRDIAESDHPLAEILEDVALQIESGSTFSAALDDHPRAFPEFMRGLVRAGEESGSLHRVLMDLVRYLEWREELRRQISSAVTYPAIVVTGMVVLGIILGAFVLPRFLEIFAELGADLPAPTRALIWTHAFFSNYGLWILAAVVASAIALVLAYRKEAPRKQIDAVLLKLPIVGSLVLMIELSRFSHNLGLLQGAGMPMLRALEMVEQVVANRVIRGVIAGGRERIAAGSTLTDGLSRGGFLPTLVIRMISVGEASGRIDESLERVATFYDREVPLLVDRTLAIFNTGVLFLLGGTITTVVLAIFVPLYSVMGDLNG